MRTFVVFLASAGYLGYIPVASGTFGSLAGIPLFYGFDHLRALSLPLYLLTFAAAVALSCWIAGAAEAYLGEHDSSKIVIDEVAGYLAATLFLPPTAANAAAAFFIFRLFDVVKPFPANHVDRTWRGGAGVVLDDVVCGVYTNLVMQLLLVLGAAGWWS